MVVRMETLGTTILSALGLGMIGGFCAILASATRRGTLEPNALFGLRTKATRSSPEAWKAGHQAASTLVETTAYTCAGFCTLIVIVGIAASHDRSYEVASWIIVGAAYCVCATMLTAAGIRADRAARRHLK